VRCYVTVVSPRSMSVEVRLVRECRILTLNEFTFLKCHRHIASFVPSRLKNSLHAQLMMKDSWRDEMKEQTREAVKRSGGRISELTLDELSERLIRAGTESVPETIQQDLKAEIRQSCYGTQGGGGGYSF
jgi:Transcription factor e(y)2